MSVDLFFGGLSILAIVVVFVYALTSQTHGNQQNDDDGEGSNTA